MVTPDELVAAGVSSSANLANIMDLRRRELLKFSPLAIAAGASIICRTALAEVPAVPTERSFSVRTYGATGDGKSVDSHAINQAVEAVAASGGGTLVFPPGPDLNRFGQTSSHGFFLRHLEHLEMSHVEIAPTNTDPRPAFWLEDVRRADFFAINAPPQANFELRNVTDLRILWSRAAKDTTLDQATRESI